MTSLLNMPNEILVLITTELGNISIKSLRCVCSGLNAICSDNYVLDMGSLKLYSHQIRMALIVLDREAQGLNTILNLDTGTGKTATVVYAYKRRPIPTVIVVAPKLKDNWLRELDKYKVNIPILTFSDSAKSFERYERVIIDEVHLSFGGDTLKSRQFIEKIAGKILWGLSASDICTTKKGAFRSYHLQKAFVTADCIVTLKLRQLDNEAKQGFHLPEFYIVNIDTYIFKVDTNIGKAITNLLVLYYTHAHKAINIITRDDVKYLRNNFLPRDDIVTDNDGNVIISGNKYHDIAVSKVRSLVYNDEFAYNVTLQNSAIIPIAKEYEEGRTIFFGTVGYSDVGLWYSRSDLLRINPRMHSKNCELYVKGEIDRLALPGTYGVGINLGKIDTLIISVNLTYKTFHQILGRINRLEQHNRTRVFIMSNFQYNREDDIVGYINQYSRQFK